MSVKLQIHSQDAMNKLGVIKMKIDKNAQSGVNEACFYLQGKVKSSISGHEAEPASVDTGRFMNSIDVETKGMDGVVFTDLDYPKHLEYGTSKINARPHFRNTASRSKDKVQQILKDKIKMAVK
jgi:hypothetical protein